MSTYLTHRLDMLSWAIKNNKPTLTKVLREQLKEVSGQLNMF